MRVRLRTRIALASFGLVAAVGALTLGASGLFYARAADRLFRDRGLQAAGATAAECAPLARYEDVAGLARAAARVRETYPDVRYVVVLDEEGSVLASTFPSGAPAALLAIPRPPVENGASVVPIRAGGEDLLDFEARHGGVRARIGMGLEAVRGPVRGAAALAALVGAAGLAAAFLASLRIARPVEALSRTVERAVRLDRETGGSVADAGTVETRAIADGLGALIDRLEERTRQLDATKKLAYLGEISADIAHEVNNPLGVIAMNADFLLRRAMAGELAPETVVEVERLDGAARRATLAVQKLLQFARYAVHGGAIARRPVAIEPLVRETLVLLEGRARLAGCEVEIESPWGLPPVSCDESGIQQVLFNLLTNAFDAAPGGRVVVRTSVDGDAAVLRVADDGAGMPPDVLRRSTEPFFTTKGPGKGTGLGLAISEMIVRAHGGSLSFESAPGRGTTATVRLPLDTIPS